MVTIDAFDNFPSPSYNEDDKEKILSFRSFSGFMTYGFLVITSYGVESLLSGFAVEAPVLGTIKFKDTTGMKTALLFDKHGVILKSYREK